MDITTKDAKFTKKKVNHKGAKVFDQKRPLFVVFVIFVVNRILRQDTKL